MNKAMPKAGGVKKNHLRAQLDEISKVMLTVKLGETAEDFDRVHSVHRALEADALNCILPPANLRPYLIQEVECSILRDARMHLCKSSGKKPVMAPEIVEVADPTLAS